MAPCQSTTYTTKRPPSSSVTTHYAMTTTTSTAIGAKTNIDPILSRHSSSSSLPRVSLVENQPQQLPPPLVLHRSKRRTVAFAVNIEKLDIPVAPVRACSASYCAPTSQQSRLIPSITTREPLSHEKTTTQSSSEGAREASPKTAQRTDVDDNTTNPKIDDEDLGGPSTTATATTTATGENEKDHNGSISNNNSSSTVNDRLIQTTTTITTTTNTSNTSNTKTITKTNDDVVEKKKNEGGLGLNLTISTPMLDIDPLHNKCGGGPVPVSPHTSCTLEDPMTAALTALVPPTVPFPILKKRKRGRPSRADKLLMIAAEAALAKAAAATAIAAGLPATTVPPTFEAAFVAASSTVTKAGRRRRSLVSGIPSSSSLLPSPPPQPKVQRVKYDMEAVPLVKLNPTMWEQFRNQKSGKSSSSSSSSALVSRPPQPLLTISSSEDDEEEQVPKRDAAAAPFLKESVLWIPESRKDWEDTISEMKSVCTSAAYRRWCAAQDANHTYHTTTNTNTNSTRHVPNNNNNNTTTASIIPSLLSSSQNSKVLANAASGAAGSSPSSTALSSKTATAPTTTAAPIFIPPLQQSFIKDRMKYDDPLRGYQVRHTTGGWLQGFLVYTTMSIWVEDFQWNSQHPSSGVVDDPSVLKDHDNTFAAGLSSLQMSPPDPVDGGRVLHGVAEVSLLGGLGCGELLLRKAVDDIVRTNTTIAGDETAGKYQYIVMQATEGSRPFYEKYGFKRVGALCRYRWAGYNKRGLNGTYINTKKGSAVTLTGKNTTIEAATTNRKRKKKVNSSSVPPTTTTTTTSSHATTTQAKAASTGTASSSSSSSLPSKTDSSSSTTAPLELYRGVPTESLADIGLAEWPEGWNKVVTQRQGGKSAGQSDSYWYSPIEQFKLRSIVGVKQFLLALRHSNQDETSAKRTMHNFSVDPKTILPDRPASSSSAAVHEGKVSAGTKIVAPSMASLPTPPSPPPPPPPVGELVGYRHWTYTNESAKSLDLHGGPSVMMCLPLTDAYLLSTPFASSVQSIHDDQNNVNNNNTTTSTTTTVATLLAPHIVKDKPLIQSLGNVNNTNSDDLVPTRKSSRRSSTGKDESSLGLGFGGGVVDLITPTLTATPPPPTGTSIIGGRRTSNRSKRCSSTLSNTDYVTTPYGQQQKITHTGSGNPKHNSNTPPTKNAKRSRGSSSNRKRPRHTRKGSENSSSLPSSAGRVVDAVKSAVSSLLTALSPATTSSAMALMNNTSTANTKNRQSVQQLKRNGSGQFISPANRISGNSLDCAKENFVGQSTTDENSLPSSSSTTTTTTTTLKKKKKKSKYRYPTTPPTRVSSRAVKACEILSVASHSTKTYSTDAMNEAMANSNKRARADGVDEDNDSKSSKKKARVAAPDDYMTASSLLPATSSQVQASSYLDDDTINDDSRRYSKRRSQLLVSIDKSKLCKQKMKSYPRSRIHYYNKIVFRKRSSILNSIIMDNDNNNSFTTDDPNSSSSSWFKQRAYNGGTMIDHRYEYCYYFVLHYDESASKVTLVPMIRNGLFTSGKYKTAKVGPRYRYQCNVLDTNRNWMIDVPADDYEVVDKAIMIMKTSFVASEAWDIYDNETADKTVDGTIAA